MPNSPAPIGERNPAKADASTVTDSAIEAHFRVTWPGHTGDIGWFREVSGLSAEIEMMDWAQGGENSFVKKLPGRIKWPNIVLKSGVTSVKQLTDWFLAAQNGERSAITIQLVTQTGDTVRTWVFKGALPVKWSGPNMNVQSNNIAVETLELCHEGLDTSAAG